MIPALGTPDPLRAARVVDGPAADHRLGSENAAVRRIAAALDRAAGTAPSARVPLHLLGAAVAAPTGGRFDDTDAGDRALLARILDVFGLRFEAVGWEVRDVPAAPAVGAVVAVDRRSPRGAMMPRSWRDVASRAELARWADRAADDEPDDLDVDEPDALAVQLGRTAGADARAAAAAALRAVGGPPPVMFGDGRPVPPSSARPLVVANGLTPPPGCSGGRDGILCADAPGGRWRCPRCGAVTALVERVAGPRLVACECYTVLCLHPARPVPSGAAPSARPARGRAS